MGLGAFGGSLFDADGQLTLSQGGFINWLDFLQQAQALPGFILDTDTQRLRDHSSPARWPTTLALLRICQLAGGFS